MINLTDLTDASIANNSVKWGMGGGSVTSIFGFLSNSDLLMIIGVLTTALGFVVNLYYQYRRDARAKAEHELQMALLKSQIKKNEEASN